MNAVRPRGPVPVVLLAGFLGAGKTTVLNHLLRSGSGLRIGVVVNDFGAVSIDALLVSGAVDGAVTLGNGCICCTTDADSLESVMGELVKPAAGLDVVVIEASGLAEPTALVRMVTAARADRILYGGLIYLVDAEQFDDTRGRHPQIDHHIALADLVLVNKTDRVSVEQAASVHETIRGCNASAAVLATTHGVLDPAMLIDLPDTVADNGPRQLELADLLTDDHDDHEHEHADHAHLHDGYQSVDFATDAPLHPRALAELLERPPVGVYRVKGVVFFDAPGHRGRYVVHGVGGHISVTATRWAPDESPTTHLTVIGAGVDVDEVRAAIEATVAGDRSTDRQSMLAITRYQQQGRRAS